MPTKIETIYDAIVDLIEGELTTYTRLPNPYALDENDFLRLTNGFGVAIGAGVDTQRSIGCIITWERAFSISLVRRVVTTQSNVTKRETIEKEILVDHDLVRKAVYLDTTLGGNVMKATIVDDGGVNFIDGERQKFLAIDMTLLVEYQENPNA